MQKENSAGAIVFYKPKKGDIEYLLLRHHKKYWNFPKGKIEEGESVFDAAKRETREETGIGNLKIIPNFGIWENYYFKSNREGSEGETISKKVVFYLGQSNTQKVKISDEHSGYRWLPYEKALELLGFKKSKNILEKANDFLIKGKQKTD
jgi:bis(5'-nucleosidyl)-tetraphosphatase